MSLACAKEILKPAAVVLSVGWSAFVAAVIKGRATAVADLCTAGIGRRKQAGKPPRRASEAAAQGGLHAQRH
jgi:hypothetical protein